MTADAARPSPADSEHRPTIVIVGAVAAGASAATRARRMNEQARIILFEKDEHVSFANCGLPYYIGGEIEQRDKLLVAKPQMLRDRFNLEVRTRCEVTAIDRAHRRVTVRDHQGGGTFTQPYDKLILAPGAAPIVPPVKGMDAANVFTLRNLQDTDRIKDFIARRPTGRAVVVGAGFIGLEMVEMFLRLKMRVSLVELQTQVLPPLDVEMARMVERELRRHEVDLRLGSGLQDFELERADGRDTVSHVVLDDGSRLAADVVIVGIGVRPNAQLAAEAGLRLGESGGIRVNEFLQTSDPDIYAAGDAVEYTHAVADLHMRVPLAGPANRSGRLAGEHAATGRCAPMPPVLGTAIVRVFDTVAAVTGCNERCVARLGGTVQRLYITANHHAGYYPGAQSMTLKLLYRPDDGKLLGAQIVGGEGVDKRIDVLATLIHLGGTVQDLTELDLAYAPPFGSAKDPLHMAGFAAANERDGLVQFVQPGVDLSTTQVVDMRTAPETAKQPLVDAPHALHIPIDELRRRLGELDPGRPTVAVCASGLRSYIGARILMQHGFRNVADLTGGAAMRAHATNHEPTRT